MLLTQIWVGVLAEDFQLNPVSRQLVKTRLGKYTGSNKQREATLKQLLVEAGCEQNISEQKVRGSKLPNVICILPGNSDKVIIVGAHFDRVSDGEGVVDNWSSASLLPSF